MAVMFDIYCPECDHQEIDVMINTNEPMPKCVKCGAEMKRFIGCTHFELKYDNRKDSCDWSGNSSQYWNEIKEKGGLEPSNNRQTKWI